MQTVQHFATSSLSLCLSGIVALRRCVWVWVWGGEGPWGGVKGGVRVDSRKGKEGEGGGDDIGESGQTSFYIHRA